MRRVERPRPPDRNLREQVLTICPVCRVWGPTALLEKHLAEDHGLSEEYDCVPAGAD